MNYNILWLKEEVWGDLFISVYCTSVLSLSLSQFADWTEVYTHTHLSLSNSVFLLLSLSLFLSLSHTHAHTHTRTLKHHFPTTHLSRLSFFLLHLHEVKNVFISSLSHTRTRTCTRRFKLSLSSTHSHTLSFICFVVV